MAYSTYETSAASGRPIELYEFRREAFVWRYTSTDADVTFDANLYTAVAISRSSIERGPELNRASLQITMQRDLEVVEAFRENPPSDAVTLTLRQYHVGDNASVLLWSGRIVTVTTWDEGNAKMTLEPVFTSLRRTGLRRMYQKQCPHVLYGTACKASSTSFRVIGNVDQINGSTVQLSEATGYTVGYFAGGWLEWLVAVGTYERRFIERHSGNNLYLTVPPTGLEVGDEIRVYAGCDHTLTTCNTKFNNALNFGGLPYIPSKNPFNGVQIF